MTETESRARDLSPKRTLPAPPLRLRGLNRDQLTAFFHHHGHPAFRAAQVYDWVFAKGIERIDAMSNLSLDQRAWLGEQTQLGGLELLRVSGADDQTQKLLLRTDSGDLVESVLMRDDFDREELGPPDPPRGSTPAPRKVSLCVSSQVGCALACRFCATGMGGFRRNLRPDEILDQLLQARRLLAPDERIANVVYMGMGEPMLNPEAVADSLRILTDPKGLGISTRKVTVSTAGVLPGMRAFADAGIEANLAVSLHAADQALRDRLMPGCRRWPLDQLIELCRRWPLTKRRRITFEYVLLKDVNDRPEDLRRLVKLLHGVQAKINLMLYNPTDARELQGTDEARAEEIRDELARAHYCVSLRRSKGRRHDAACGQLAAHARREAEAR